MLTRFRPPVHLAALLVLTLAACTPDSGPVVGVTPAPDDTAGACGAFGLQDLVGQPVKALETMRFDQVVRIIRPDTAVTMDYAAERLNIEVDEADVITRVFCG